MAEPIIPPRRREEFFNKDGTFTLRALRFFEDLTGDTNTSTDELENIDQTDTSALFSMLDQVASNESELGFFDGQPINTEEIESELGFSDDPIPVIESLRNAVATAIDYTTSESEVVVCTEKLTVILNPIPDDQELSTITRTNGKVIVSGNGKLINKDPTVVLIRDFVSLDFLYLKEIDRWTII